MGTVQKWTKPNNLLPRNAQTCGNTIKKSKRMTNTYFRIAVPRQDHSSIKSGRASTVLL